jgi:phage regulator Rha-like protein
MEIEIIRRRIYQMRGFRVMLDSDLAELYQVSTKALKQAIRRNIERFPGDFMFELSLEEYKTLRSQFVTLETGESLKGKHSKYSAYAFTEQGVAMLSSVLRSHKAIQVNISIMRAFVILRQNLMDIEELRNEIHKLEEEINLKFDDIYQAINYLSGPSGQRKVIKGYQK